MSIFEQIRNAFGKADDKPAGTKEHTEGAEPPTPAPGRYTVQSGDTLWKIAVEVYGDGARYTEIFEANRDLLDSPDHILPGQELELPPA